ncbi:hypothetical protein WMY93_032362, partial [Mugilogobius chulae]
QFFCVVYGPFNCPSSGLSRRGDTRSQKTSLEIIRQKCAALRRRIRTFSLGPSKPHCTSSLTYRLTPSVSLYVRRLRGEFGPRHIRVSCDVSCTQPVRYCPKPRRFTWITLRMLVFGAESVDQIHLLKCCWLEILMLGSCGGQIVDHLKKFHGHNSFSSHNDFSRRLDEGQCVEGIIEIFDMLLAATSRFRELKLQREEYVCLKAMILLNSNLCNSAPQTAEEVESRAKLLRLLDAVIDALVWAISKLGLSSQQQTLRLGHLTMLLSHIRHVSNKGMDHLSTMKRKNVVLAYDLLLEMLDANTSSSSHASNSCSQSQPEFSPQRHAPGSTFANRLLRLISAPRDTPPAAPSATHSPSTRPRTRPHPGQTPASPAHAQSAGQSQPGAPSHREQQDRPKKQRSQVPAKLLKKFYLPSDSWSMDSCDTGPAASDFLLPPEPRQVGGALDT